MLITIDGPAGVGKSTIAAILAEKLGLPYLNSGAMFRCLALHIGQDPADLSGPELAERAGQIHFSLQGAGKGTVLLCNGEPAGPELRSERIGRLASMLGTRQEARDALLAAQRRIGENQELITEGRDMGTLVFPNASHKFFLDADPVARARRRWLELQALGQPADLREIEAAIRERDRQDRERPIAPLKPARDATLIDTSNLSIPEVTAKMMRIIEAGGGLGK